LNLRRCNGVVELFMLDRHDKVLLDKQLWGVNPTPPSLAGLALLAVFVGGIIIGSLLFAREHKQTRTVSNDVTGSIFKPDESGSDPSAGTGTDNAN
jgi:hypothetical protein